MSTSGMVYECLLASRRLAEAKSVAELEKEWSTTKQNFEKSWESNGHKLIILVHDEYSSIGDEDVTQALGTINSLKKAEPVDVILHTKGGSASATMQIAEVLVERPRTAAFVPFFAWSGGTMIALSTGKIFLGNGAALGPLDLQYGNMRARDVVQIAEELGEEAPPEWRAAARDAKRALADWTKKICERINRHHKGIFGWRGCALANTLTNGEMYHGQAINFALAKRLHMRVSTKVPKSAYVLISVRLEQLRRLRELESQMNLVEKASGTGHVGANTETMQHG